MAANYFLFVAQHNAIITIIILANRVWYVFRVSATTSSPLEYLEATDEDQRTLFPAMLGSCRGNAPARSSCFPAKLTIGCTIHYTGNSTLPIMFTTLFLVYGLPFWVFVMWIVLWIVLIAAADNTHCAKGCRAQTQVFSQIKSGKWLSMVSRWTKLSVLHEIVTKSLQENKLST